MEIILAAVVAIIAIVYFGFDNSIEAGARMANRSVERLEAEQIIKDIAYYNGKGKISEEDYTTAVAQKELIKSYRGM
jgi:uncharacterized membrane protein